MKKTLPVIFVATLWFAGFLGIVQAQNGFSVGDVGEENKIGEVNKQDDLNAFDPVAENVNDMLTLMEGFGNDGGLSEKLKVSEDEKGNFGKADPLDQFIKPDEPSHLMQSSQERNKTRNNIEMEDEVVKFIPGDSDSYFRRGLDYWRSKNLDEAIWNFEEALRRDPENAHAYWNLGLLYEEKKNETRAIVYIKKAEAIYLKYNYSVYAEEARKHLENLSRKNENSSVGASLSK